MKNIVIGYFIIVLLYWFKLMFSLPAVGIDAKAFLFGRALVWPFILLQWIFS